MRRGYGIFVAIVLILAAIAVGVGAYNAGFSEGVRDGSTAGEVVVVGHGHHAGFGWIFIALLIFALFAVKAGRWGHHRHWDGPYGRDRIEEMHRRLHEEEKNGPATA